MLLLFVVAAILRPMAFYGAMVSRCGPCPGRAHSKERGGPAVDGPAIHIHGILRRYGILCVHFPMVSLNLRGSGMVSMRGPDLIDLGEEARVMS